MQIMQMRIAIQEETKNAKYSIWQTAYKNGPQNTALARIAVMLTLVLIGEATTALPATTRVFVAATLRLTVAATFPLGLYFM